MYIGHFAPAMIAASHPKAPGLGTLFIASQLVDFAFFGLAIAGIEKFRVVPGITELVPLDFYFYPYTHSLVGSLLWSLVFAGIVYAFSKNRTGAIIAGIVVACHWFLDLVVHPPDLTIAGNPPKLGFSLWDQPAVAMSLELLLTFGAMAFFLSRTKSKGSNKPLYFLIAILTIFQLVNWFGPPPEKADVPFMLTALISFTVATLFAWWLGKTRTVKAA